MRRQLFDALNAANAVRPFNRRGQASLACWVAALPTSELPLEALATEALATLVDAKRGKLDAKSLAVQGIGWAQLLYLARSARASEGLLDAALADALGPSFPVVQPKPDVVPKNVGAARTVGLRRRYVQHGDIPYGPDPRRNLLDVWRHPDLPRDANAPVVVQVHGGAWVTGNKTPQAYPLMSHLAELGWVCVSISYRLAPKDRWPAQIVDVKRAIAWVKDNIAEYGGDPSFVAITGGSAGGHLASLAALTPNDPAYQPGFTDADTSVRAAVPFYGAYDFTDRHGLGHKTLVRFLERRVIGEPMTVNHAIYDTASPMSRVHADAPPFFVLHGVNDALIPVEQADRFVDLLRAVSREPVAYARLPHAQHAFDVFGSVRAHHAAAAAARFLGSIYARPRIASS